MIKNNLIYFTLFCFAALFSFVGCQDEQFGYDAKTISFRTNFMKQFGEIPSDQDWDLSRSMTRTAKYTPWNHGDITRAIPGINPGASSDIIVPTDDSDWYDVLQETLDWMHSNLVEGNNNTVAGEPFSLLPPTQNDFALIPIYIGQHKMDWTLHLVTADADYTVWSEYKDGYSEGIQVKDNAGSGWRNVASNDNTLNAYDVQARPIRINHEAITSEFFFYLSVDKGHMRLSGYDYADGNYAKTGTAQRSDEGMMLALNCPIPSNIGKTGELQNEVMIISCEDSNEENSDYDMNDLVFLIVGYPNIPDLIEYTRKRYMCEDLGNTFDFDFNDVVVDVDQSVTKHAELNESGTWVDFIEDPSTFRQFATIRHLCGTLPFRLKVGNTEFNTVSDPTAHQQTITELGGSQSDNGAGVNWNPDVEKQITGWNADENNIYLRVSNKVNPLEYVFTDKFGTEVVQNKPDEFIYTINFPEAGSTPMIVCVDQTVDWMPETVHIPESWWKTGEVFYKSVSITASPENAGTFTGDGSYANGSKVTITARANEGYVFDQWSDGNKDNPRTFNSLNSNIQLVAYFRERQQVTLSWSATGIDADKVAISATIDDVAQTSGSTYYEGTVIRFNAISSDPQREFVSWSIGENRISSSSNFSYTVNGEHGTDICLVANFAAPWWDVAVTDNVVWSGSQQLGGYYQYNELSDFNGDGQPAYHETTGSYRPAYQRLIKSLKTGCRYLLFQFESPVSNGQMTVRAANWDQVAQITNINKGYVLVTLTDEQAKKLIDNNGMRIEFNLNGKLTSIKALSEEPDFMLSINVSATEGGTATVSKAKVDMGESVTLTATPDAGKAFRGWRDDATDAIASTDNPWIIQSVNQSLSYTAVFADAEQYHVSISALSDGKVVIGGTEYTPGNAYSADVVEGTAITVEAKATSQGYRFKQWSDGNTNPTRTIQVTSDITLSASFEEGPAGPVILFEGNQSTANCQQIQLTSMDDLKVGSVVKIYFTGSWLNVHYGQWNQSDGWNGSPRTKTLTENDVNTIKSRGLWAHGDGNVTKVTVE